MLSIPSVSAPPLTNSSTTQSTNITCPNVKHRSSSASSPSPPTWKRKSLPLSVLQDLAENRTNPSAASSRYFFRQDRKSEFKLFLMTFFAEPDSGHTGNPLLSNDAISIGSQSTEVGIAQRNNPAKDSGGKNLNGYFFQKSTVAIQSK